MVACAKHGRRLDRSRRDTEEMSSAGNLQLEVQDFDSLGRDIVRTEWLRVQNTAAVWPILT